MKFSVIIPLYNKAPYIRKALESVLAQTYTDYELIIIDDGSTDGSAEIAEAFLQTPASRLSPLAFRLLKQKNAGVSAARNNGFSVSSAEYLAFLDADDWWGPTYLERMAQLIADYPDAGLYACNYVYYKPGKTHVAINNIETGYINYPKAYYESNTMPVWTGAAMIPRKVFDEMGGFRTHLWMAEDFDLWIRIAIKHKVVFLKEPHAYYNQDVQLKWRALGKLYPPIRQFAFDADYLIPYQKQNIDVQHVVDMVKIICLEQYYISQKYHHVAKFELTKIDVTIYKMHKFASYVWTPVWILRLKKLLCNLYNLLKF